MPRRDSASPAEVAWARLVIVGPSGTRLELLLVGKDAPDGAAVDGLANLCLALRRAGGRLQVEEMSSALGELLDFVGLRREVSG